jgi:putative intracellular protease/amidase
MSALGTKVLIVVTSHASLGATGRSTGYYLSEVTHPYAALEQAGFVVDIASPRGGKAPVDDKSLELDDPVNRAFWDRKETRAQLEETLPLRAINASDYRAIVFAGGHGTMWDFPDDGDVQRVAGAIYDAGGVVAAVCHGPAALVNVRLADGRSLVDGKNVAGFSNAEESAAGLTAVMPFLLESKLVERGGKYSKSGLWQPHVVTDGRLVTGQNPASATGVGEAVAGLLKP